MKKPAVTAAVERCTFAHTASWSGIIITTMKRHHTSTTSLVPSVILIPYIHTNHRKAVIAIEMTEIDDRSNKILVKGVNMSIFKLC